MSNTTINDFHIVIYCHTLIETSKWKYLITKPKDGLCSKFFLFVWLTSYHGVAGPLGLD